MKRKKKKPKKDKVTPEVQKSPEILFDEGLRHFNNNRFRDAIHIFKILVKKQDKPEWVDYLAQAYKGRVKELINKDMYKEAFSLLEHMKSVCHREPEPFLYIQALLGVEHYKEAFVNFLTIEQKDRDNILVKKVESIFASLILSGEQEIISSVPQDHPLILHRQVVIEAIEALAQGKDDSCRELIQKIPLRSPYRDFRLFLRGLLSFYNDNEEEALTFFEKISDYNSIKKLATALALFMQSIQTHEELLFKKTDLQFLATLFGKDTHFVKVIDNIVTSFTKGNYSYIFSQFKNHMNFFEEPLVKRFCHGLMAKNISLRKHYETLFEKVTPFEYYRLKALSSENNRDLESALDNWEDCLDNLTPQTYGDGETEKIARALILRKMAAIEAKFAPPMPFMDQDREYEIELLESSLEFDPYDRSTYDKVIDYYEEVGTQKDVKKWIDSLVSYFPEDRSALFRASENALERKTYTKAISFLDRILKIDPINREAREKKVFIHITKARNDIKKKKYHLARKEFEAATTCGQIQSESKGSTLIKWGTMELLAQNIERGDELIREGYNLSGANIGAAFLVTVESKRMGLASSQYEEYSDHLKRFLKTHTIDFAMELVNVAILYCDVDYTNKEGDKKIVQTYLKKTANHSYTSSELLKICLYLFMSYDFTLLKKYSERGIKEYPEILLFIYYFMMGKCRGEIYKLTYQDKLKMEDALERAIKAGDRESASKFEMILQHMEMSSFLSGGKGRQLRKLINKFLKRKEGQDTSMDDVYDLFDEIEDDEEFDDSFPKQKKFPF